MAASGQGYSDFLTLPLDHKSALPLRQQIRDGVRRAIQLGQLRSGQRIPSTRVFSRLYKVSRNTAMIAFEQLTAEGYLESQRGAGTYISHSIPDRFLCAKKDPGRSNLGPESVRTPDLARRVQTLRIKRHDHPASNLIPFQLGLPEARSFPLDIWTRLISKYAHRLSRQSLACGSPLGFQPLRQAVAAHLNYTRGMYCSAEQVIITSGAQQALRLVLEAVVDEGDAVCMEDPGYQGLRQALVLSGAKVIPIPVDRDGLDISKHGEEVRDTKLACVTPSHQFPLGYTMSLRRRDELLRWAYARRTWILEDDSDCDFRFGSQPLPSIHSLDRHSRVFYVGTFGKVVFPALRLGFLVVPATLVDVFERLKRLADGFTPVLQQVVLAEFIGQGHLGRHLRCLRAQQEERCRYLACRIRDRLSPWLEVIATESGTSLTALCSGGLEDMAISHQTLRHGVVTRPLSPCYAGQGKKNGLILGFSGSDCNQVDTGIARLRAVLQA